MNTASRRGIGLSLLLTLAAAAQALTFAPGPLPDGALALVQVLTLAVLARATLRSAGPRQALLRGWWYATVYFSIGLYWLYVSMHDYGDLSAPLAAGGVLILSAFLALFPGAACALARRLLADPTQAPWRAMLIWAAAWTLFEWLRATVLTGFPWLNIGYAQVDSPIAGWAPILGVHGMAFVAAAAAAALAGLWPSRGSGRPTRGALIALALALVLALLGWPLRHIAWSQPVGRPLNARLVQGNVPQSDKFNPALIRQGLQRHFELAGLPPAHGEPAPDVIILPETVLPVFQDQLPPQVWNGWRDVAARQHAAIIMGVPLHTIEASGRARYTNSAIGLNADTPLDALLRGRTEQRYDKRHLVPWGEYVPPGFHWFIRMLNIPLGDFDRGAERQKPFAIAGQELALNICYEDLFGPALLPALQPMDGEPGATVLVNISNLGWFGDTWALRQHLQIGRVRTLETARPMITATNTGITAAIDAHGRVVSRLAPHTIGVLAVTVQGMRGLTPYARLGDLPIVLIVAAILLAAAACAWRRQRSAP
ncbi:apolipoprotein N-acyltransferase [Bordetella sp. FB-8]|uniref:apolipoprotein N-acyltransferase n=1 Tax=Bordetella sp. FB-8 TaxID=1159870 RepID=UPI000371393C|nr:apolipoprotein N-acyltransferase [Bordetella sp. FB-8]